MQNRPLIVEIQYLRAIAVLMVLFAHLHQADARFLPSPLLGDAAFTGFAGVDVFFVISGFIIHRLFRDTKQPGKRFLLHRINRIYPMYWLFTLAALAGYLSMSDRLTLDWSDLNIWQSFALVPTNQPPVLVVGWTLSHEMYFYLAYSLYLACPKQSRPWAALSWITATLAANLLIDMDGRPVTGLIFSPFNLQFMAGALIAQFHDRLSVLRWPALVLATAGFAGAMIWTGDIGLNGLADPAHRVLAYTPFAVALVIAALTWKAGAFGALSRLGDASYVFYLSHILVVGILVRLFADASRTGLFNGIWPSLLFYAAATIISIVLALLAHRWIEKPILACGKSLIDRQSS